MVRFYYWYQIDSTAPFTIVPKAIFLIVSVIHIVAISEYLGTVIPS